MDHSCATSAHLGGSEAARLPSARGPRQGRGPGQGSRGGAVHGGSAAEREALCEGCARPVQRAQRVRPQGCTGVPWGTQGGKALGERMGGPRQRSPAPPRRHGTPQPHRVQSLGFRKLNGNEFNEILKRYMELIKLGNSYRPLKHRLNKTRGLSVIQRSDCRYRDYFKKVQAPAI